MHDQLLDATPWAPLIYKIHYSGDLTNIVQKVRAEHVMTQPNIGVMAGGGKTSVLNQGKAPHGWQEMKPIPAPRTPMLAATRIINPATNTIIALKNC